MPVPVVYATMQGSVGLPPTIALGDELVLLAGLLQDSALDIGEPGGGGGGDTMRGGRASRQTGPFFPQSLPSPTHAFSKATFSFSSCLDSTSTSPRANCSFSSSLARRSLVLAWAALSSYRGSSSHLITPSHLRPLDFLTSPFSGGQTEDRVQEGSGLTKGIEDSQWCYPTTEILGNGQRLDCIGHYLLPASSPWP